MKQPITVGLVGNPNSGKTTLFNALTGAKQRVGNWPGVTVEKKSGHCTHAERSLTLVDLPGTYSLHVSHEDASVDEQIAQAYILSGAADVIINIIDASNLERNLYLTTQLMDANIPIVIALNMIDVANTKGIHINPIKLSEQLGCPVVPVIASKGEGITTLLDVIESQADSAAQDTHLQKPQYTPKHFSGALKNALDKLTDLAQQHADHTLDHSLLATALLERDPKAQSHFPAHVHAQLDVIVDGVEQSIEGSLHDHIATRRYEWANTVASASSTQDANTKVTLTDRIDALFLNRWLAIPLFLAVMYVMFFFTINIGSAFIDAFDGIAGALFVDTTEHALQLVNAPDWLIAILANGVGGGIQLVASFIPVIGCLFLFLSFLEASGYMARAAFIIDRLMCSIGLPGKAFVPLIVGFGCNVPSVMAARTLDKASDRLMTTIMAPFMSCGARLTVYALFAAAFFPKNGQNIVFGLYIIGILLAVISAFIVRRFMLSSELSPFIMELPSYHVPTLKGVLIRTWQRLKGFILRAGKAIVVVVVALNFLNNIGTDGSFGNQDTEKSVLSAIGKSITPVFEPMGMNRDNWPAAVGVFTGLFAKEVVVGTLDTLYQQMTPTNNIETQPESSASFGESFIASIGDALQTIPENLAGASEQLGDPLGLDIGDVSNTENAAEAQSVEVSTIATMQRLFDGQAAAFAYLLFVLLYVPCVATLGAIYKESGGFWASFTTVWTFVTAYTVAVGYYQIATFTQHPSSSALWLGAMLAILIAGYASLILLGRRKVNDSQLIDVVNIN